jgi:sugar transferase (PEP-CTERM/EpsH1 system associated)
MLADTRPLVVHVMHRFDVGGLENGIVNLINHMPAAAYRHAVVALTEVTDFRRRVLRDDVEFIALHKPPGHGVWLYPQLYRLFRRLRPAILHSRNLAALETVVPAWLAGVPVRLHGEHGRDVEDLDGASRRHQWLRRIYRPFVQHYFALSRDLASYLIEKIGVPPSRVTQVYNGVDPLRFRPAESAVVPAIPGCPFGAPAHWIVGTVGRMQAVKDQVLLARAFVQALREQPSLRERLRLVMVGEGPLKAQALAELQAAGVADLAWLPGERADVPEVMRGLQCFVLPSLAEGISNTILEAMASGVPVIATAVGGNADLVDHGRSGEIVPAGDVQAMANALLRLASDPARAASMGRAGRADAEQKFSMQAMVAAYQGRYDAALRAARTARTARGAPA